MSEGSSAPASPATMEPVGIHATERRNHEAEQRGSDRTRQRKIGRTADRLRERARLRRGAGVPAGLLTAGSGLSGSGAEAEAANGSITLTEWTTETDCSTCHADEASSRQDAACTASKHTSLQCADCHTDTATLAKQHEGASSDDRMPSRLKQTTVEASVCLSCHDQDEIAAESSSCTALSDAQAPPSTRTSCRKPTRTARSPAPTATACTRSRPICKGTPKRTA